MTHQEILTKAIEKAIAGGFAGSIVEPDIYDFPETWIFNHDFAKALWGEETQAFGGIPRLLMKWQYHLQQMVVAEDPIAYLGEHI